MPVIGLTGCPGAGKSTAAKLFEKLGARVLSGDEIGRHIVDSNEQVRRQLAEEFGADILDEQGELNRRLLGKRAFASKHNLEKLNRIVHPLLLIEMKQLIDKHRDENPDKMLIVDAALIYEWGVADWFDAIVVVFADYWLRIKRMRSNGLTDREAAERTDSQIEQEEKVRRADYTIENNGLPHEMEGVVKKLYSVLVKK